MGDRAYFSGRAILQINTCARLQSHECASEYPIPRFPLRRVIRANRDLRGIITMLKDMRASGGYISNFLDGADSLWMSNLFVDLARAQQPLCPDIYLLLCTAHITRHQATNANLFLAWYVFLGGDDLEEEIFWVIDKLCVVASSFVLSTCLQSYPSVIAWRQFFASYLQECGISSTTRHTSSICVTSCIVWQHGRTDL